MSFDTTSNVTSFAVDLERRCRRIELLAVEREGKQLPRVAGAKLVPQVEREAVGCGPEAALDVEPPEEELRYFHPRSACCRMRKSSISVSTASDGSGAGVPTALEAA